MSKTKRNTERRAFETNPLTRHVVQRRCDFCQQWYPIEDITTDENGTWCVSCDTMSDPEPVFVEDD